MDYMPVPASVPTDETIFDAPPGSSWTRYPARKRPDSTLRYRALELDTTTGGVYVNERPVRLGAGERDLLKALMRRAGQIVSAGYLAEQSECASDEIEAHVVTLTKSLAEAGASCLPRRVEGLGYILWR